LGGVGGRPSVIPSTKIWADDEDERFAFTLEMKVDGTMLSVPGASYIQFYQPLDAGDFRDPIVAVI